ncbi:MAG: cation transporter [Clostridia bacterium]|nr:cation transporter [Clostridia bacterium]
MTSLLIKLFIKNGDNTKDKNVRNAYGNLASITGIICNIALSFIKIIIGVIVSSISIIADGLNNLSDMGSSVISLIGFKLAGKPADRDHPFGHGRIEYMSAFIISVLILIVGGNLLFSSAKTLIGGGSAPVYDLWTIIILGVSILIKLWMFFFNRKIGKKIDSAALLATAKDSINDVVTTSAILMACLIDNIWTLPFNLDAVIALFVSLFIIHSGLTSAKDTTDQLLGGPPDKELIKEIEDTILGFDDFIGIHDLIVHNYGPGRQLASVHVEVPYNINIVECHEQIDACEKLICEKTGVELVIHMDPIDTDNEAVSKAREDMAAAIKNIHPAMTLHDFRMTPNAKNRTNLIFDVVVPSDLKMTKEETNEKICALAKEINKTYCCVITFDTDYIGN